MTTTTTRRRLLALATATALAAALTGCASTATDPAEAGPGAVAAADHTDADAWFAQMMIVHHEGAIEMAELAQERATTDAVRGLADRIAAAQGPEIEQMSGWLEEWGEPGPHDMGHAGMDHGGMDMEGMGQDEAMGDLDDLQGPEFDRRFLELMTAHHQGAIEMSEEELEEGRNPEALALARAIIDAQTAEIEEMAGMLDEL